MNEFIEPKQDDIEKAFKEGFEMARQSELSLINITDPAGHIYKSVGEAWVNSDAYENLIEGEDNDN